MSPTTGFLSAAVIDGVAWLLCLRMEPEPGATMEKGGFLIGEIKRDEAEHK